MQPKEQIGQSLDASPALLEDRLYADFRNDSQLSDYQRRLAGIMRDRVELTTTGGLTPAKKNDLEEEESRLRNTLQEFKQTFLQRYATETSGLLEPIFALPERAVIPEGAVAAALAAGAKEGTLFQLTVPAPQKITVVLSNQPSEFFAAAIFKDGKYLLGGVDYNFAELLSAIRSSR
jgi:hypothetical protein